MYDIDDWVVIPTQPSDQRTSSAADPLRIEVLAHLVDLNYKVVLGIESKCSLDIPYSYSLCTTVEIER